MKTSTIISIPMSIPWDVIAVLVFLNCSSHSGNCHFLGNQIAKVRTLWRNNPISCPSRFYTNGSMVNIIIDPPQDNLHFALGFYSDGNSTSTSFILAIFLHHHKLDAGFPQVIWSANRNNPVKGNATLELTQEGDLVLKDVNNTFVWSTRTSGSNVVGLELTVTGNLVLFDSKNTTIWQSFDHPTDTLVPGQKMVEGQKLIASASTTDRSEGSYHLSVTTDGPVAYIGSDPPLSYYIFNASQVPKYLIFQNGSLSLYVFHLEPKASNKIYTPSATLIQYLQYGSDGRLRVYGWRSAWELVTDDILSLDQCYYPLACGEYGICSSGQCSCPQETNDSPNYFCPINSREPNLGCPEITPLSCEASKHHLLLTLTSLTRFNMGDKFTATDIEGCKEACLKDCSCKAAAFWSPGTTPSGVCSIQHEVFSFIDDEKLISGFKSTIFIKVQSVENTTVNSTELSLATFLTLTCTSSLWTLFSIFLVVRIIVHWRNDAARQNENHFDFLSGILMRFSCPDLKDATQNFSHKLGEGAFGSVYKGTLINGTQIAVKRLEGVVEGTKNSFVAEVVTIGSIHHVNLVKLLGFCANESHHALVYEYICNGSLDNWIFRPKKDAMLDWETRRKIILQIARGIAYLHEGCAQTILHLDIKPQNILLDEDFNAKVADFGLSKLMAKNESKVMTAMRGTPGYMAPEWLTYTITEKVDVYSFGIVVMEILCGRKNVEFSETEECIPLVALLAKYTGEDGFFDMIDSVCDDMKLHSAEILGIMKLVLWCVHSDFRKRPSMSVVVKILESLLDVQANLNDNILSSLPSPYRVGFVVRSPCKQQC